MGINAQPTTADGVKRLVPEDDMFDVLWDTHVHAGGHCKGRTFDHRMKTRYVGIPRGARMLPHPIPSHPIPSHPVPSYLTALCPLPLPLPYHFHTTPVPSHSHPTPIPLPSHPIPLQVGADAVRRVLQACTRRVSAKPPTLAGSHPIVVRGYDTRGQVQG